jgi:hypothetical protein
MAEDLSIEELKEVLPDHVHDLRREFEADLARIPGQDLEPA